MTTTPAQTRTDDVQRDALVFAQQAAAKEVRSAIRHYMGAEADEDLTPTVERLQKAVARLASIHALLTPEPKPEPEPAKPVKAVPAPKPAPAQKAS